MAENLDVHEHACDPDRYLRSLYPVSFYLNHPIPRKLSKVTKYQYLELSNNGQIIQDFRNSSDYQGKEIPPLLLKGDCYIPPSSSVFYFEVKLLYSGCINGTFSIGICSPDSMPNKWLGMENDSFGYRNCSIKPDCTFVSQNQFHQTICDSSPKSVRSVSFTNLSNSDLHLDHRVSFEESCISEPEQSVDLMRLFRGRNSRLEGPTRLSTLTESKINLPIPQYSSGDIVGCGLNLIERTVFFTRNGVYLGSIGISQKLSANSCPLLYPGICLGGENVKISVNFGREPYSFNVLKYITTQRVNLQNHAIDQKCSSILSNLSTKRFVLSYLLYEGYYSVAKTMCPNLLKKREDEKSEQINKLNNSEDVFKNDDPTLMSPGSDLNTPLSAPIAFYDEPKWPTIKPPNKNSKTAFFKNRGSFYENKDLNELTLPMKLSQQKTFQWPENLNDITKRILIRQEIMKCNFLKALSLLSLNYPDILRKIPSIAFVLQCRHFIALLVDHKLNKQEFCNGSTGMRNGFKKDHPHGHCKQVNGSQTNLKNGTASSSSSFEEEDVDGIDEEEDEEELTLIHGNNSRSNSSDKLNFDNDNGFDNNLEIRNGHNDDDNSLKKNTSPTMKENINRPKTLQKVPHENGNSSSFHLNQNNSNHTQCDVDKKVNGHSNKIQNENDDPPNILSKIIDYGRELMAMAYTLYELKQITTSHIDLLKWAFSMLAYNNVKTSPFSCLLLPKHLEYLADSINSIILNSYNLPGEPEIKMVIRQIETLTCSTTPSDQRNCAFERDESNKLQDECGYKISFDYLNFPYVPVQNKNTDCFDDFENYENTNGNGKLLDFSFYQNFQNACANKEKVFSPNFFLTQNIRSPTSPDSMPNKESNFELVNGSELAGVFHPLLYKSF